MDEVEGGGACMRERETGGRRGGEEVTSSAERVASGVAVDRANAKKDGGVCVRGAVWFCLRKGLHFSDSFSAFAALANATLALITLHEFDGVFEGGGGLADGDTHESASSSEPSSSSSSWSSASETAASSVSSAVLPRLLLAILAAAATAAAATSLRSTPRPSPSSPKEVPKVVPPPPPLMASLMAKLSAVGLATAKLLPPLPPLPTLPLSCCLCCCCCFF
mmetsp:Transcript_1150/g.2482  ORF Transcript_1150/g.2482 Transcript_1150/m.2482 type:complete len:221 (-) Transcript_1150:507-1169(-)